MTRNKRILILGATGSIGSQLARRLSDSNQLVLMGRNSDKLDALASELGAQKHEMSSLDWRDLGEAVREAHASLGGLDAVANAVGSMLLKPIHSTREQEFDDVMQVNLKSVAAVLSALMPLLKKQGEGDRSVVMISSVAASFGLANHEAIAAAKAGVEGLVRSAAATYARSGIRVNAVAPALVETQMTERICANENARARSEKLHPLGRIGAPGDVAAAIDWLLSPDASWVTGQVLPVDGGMSRVQPAND